ncbi:MAG: division/cell wall cluster transcriptional repressor MraZ [Chloroflexi bacterium]|nr:division/cell wall cluster transcriptional repressor MraZ [Chloroflexota bacterium]
MFLGKFSHSLDDRGRVAIPARFRDEFEAGLVISRGFERCLTVYTPAGWEELKSRLAGLSFTQGDARRVLRAIFSLAFDGRLDGQGRVLVPQELRQYAEIHESVTIVGVDDHLELWEPARWAAEQAILDSQLPEIAERLHG